MNRIALFFLTACLGFGCAAEPSDGSASSALVEASECIADTGWVGDWNSEGVRQRYTLRDRAGARAAIPRAILWDQPTETADNPAPQGCPDGQHNHCIWLCNGGDPLDGIDDNTCSGNWCCPGCPGGDPCAAPTPDPGTIFRPAVFRPASR